MKKNLLPNYNTTLRAFLKLRRKYARYLASGKFITFSRTKQNQIVNRLTRLIQKLESIKTSAGSYATALTIGAFMSTSASAQFVEVTGTANPMDGFSFSGQAHPSFVDIDNDGDLDCYVGDDFMITQFINSGSTAAATFGLGGSDISTLNTGNISQDFVDIDGDGDYDIVLADENIGYYFWEYINDGTASVPSFTTPSVDSDDMGYHCGNATPDFCDIDNDGDFDLFYGTLLFSTGQQVINTGSASADTWGSQANVFSPGDWCSPHLVDFDGDGDFDAFVGLLDGTIQYYENTGDASSATFTLVTGSGNPFDGIDVGSNANPFIVNIDAESGFEAFVGNATGDLKFYDQSPASTPPVAGMMPGDSTICPDDCIDFSDASTDADDWTWTFEDGTPASSTSEDPGTVCWDTPGIYTVTLVVTGPGGADTETSTITVNPCLTPPVADFTPLAEVICVQDCITFSDGSTDADSYAWTFEGGTPATSTDANPTICWDTAGDYEITLTVTNTDGTDTKTDSTFVVGCAGLESESLSNIQFYPNPATDVVAINLGALTADYSIQDNSGRVVMSQSNVSGQQVIDVNDLAKGIYLITFSNAEGTLTKKLLIE